jgi:transcriptional regulator with PAS, ATPase and Fis domain
MPSIQLDEDAVRILTNYRWPGNVRQLKNITDQISIIEKNREINSVILLKYLPQGATSDLPVLYKGDESSRITERDLLYKVLFDMKRDMNDLKQLVMNLIETENIGGTLRENRSLLQRLYHDFPGHDDSRSPIVVQEPDKEFTETVEEPEEVEETLSLQKQEAEYIRKALRKYDGKRKDAARELGISERTLYRKIKEYDIRQ